MSLPLADYFSQQPQLPVSLSACYPSLLTTTSTSKQQPTRWKWKVTRTLKLLAYFYHKPAAVTISLKKRKLLWRIYSSHAVYSVVKVALIIPFGEGVGSQHTATRDQLGIQAWASVEATDQRVNLIFVFWLWGETRAPKVITHNREHAYSHRKTLP